MIELEVCCGDVNSMIAAKAGGARRIELCSALAEGGVTPSIALVKAACELGFEKINVLIRERTGDFLYNSHEMRVMENDAKMALDCGATGIVWGALTADGSIDLRGVERMRKAIWGADFTFHRAFDLCRDARTALEEIIGAGCNCVLTSGLAATAMEGVGLLRELTGQASGRIAVMAGSGVSSANCVEIVRQSGVRNIHASAKRRVESRMTFRRTGVAMGKDDTESGIIYETDAEEVRLILERLRNEE